MADQLTSHFSRTARPHEGRAQQIRADVQTRPREKTASHAPAPSHRRSAQRPRRVVGRRLELEPEPAHLRDELLVELPLHAPHPAHQARNPDPAGHLNDVVAGIVAGSPRATVRPVGPRVWGPGPQSNPRTTHRPDHGRSSMANQFGEQGEYHHELV